MFNFEKLDVWQDAIKFADLIYNFTRVFPDEERYGLTNQTRRAVVSVSSNIAEGSSRASRTDFARFVQIAAGSVFEVVSQALLSKRHGYLDDAKTAAIYAEAEKLNRMLSGLRRSLVDPSSRPSTLNSQPSTN